MTKNFIFTITVILVGTPLFAGAQYMPSPSQAAVTTTTNTSTTSPASTSPVPATTPTPLALPLTTVSPTPPSIIAPTNTASSSTSTTGTASTTTTTQINGTSSTEATNTDLLTLRDSLLAQIKQLESQLQTETPMTPPSSARTPNRSEQTTPSQFSGTFTRDLHVGSRGADVRALQQFLNADGGEITTTGPGSPGNETDTFGTLTKKALAIWQNTNGIMPASGYFGPKSRALINTMLTSPERINATSTSSDNPESQPTGGTTLY